MANYIDDERISAAAEKVIRLEDERFIQSIIPRAFLMGRSMGKSITTGEMFEFKFRSKPKRVPKPRSNPLLTALMKRSTDES